MIISLPAFLLLAPFALLAISHVGPHSWQKLNDVAGTYGGLATVFSMLALAGVVVSLVLQAHDTAINRVMTHRSMHSELLSKALDDPALRACWGPLTGNDDQDRQHIYTNLIFSFWRSMFEIGMIQDEELHALCAQVFIAEPARGYWARVSEHHREHHESDRDKRFTRILDEEYERARASLVFPDT
ncbi:DUF6082 family protein [Streptomyces sp. NPDC007905]|uniref:DUF6082 family protein n=1 Tax=Streptomyces sp. NPDC007905 TaxID=3364788 RepID=UPI0036EB846D